jgi:hypothetical protein
MHEFLATLTQAGTVLSLHAAIVCGSALAYLLFKMPSLPTIQARIESIFPQRSRQFRTRLECLLLIFCGWATIHYLVNPHESATAFASGFTWYSMLTALRGGT